MIESPSTATLEAPCTRFDGIYAPNSSRGLLLSSIAAFIPKHAGLIIEDDGMLGISLSREADPLLQKMYDSPKMKAMGLVMDQNETIPTIADFEETGWPDKTNNGLLLFGLERLAKEYIELAGESDTTPLDRDLYLELAADCVKNVVDLRAGGLRALVKEEVHGLVHSVAAIELMPFRDMKSPPRLSHVLGRWGR